MGNKTTKRLSPEDLDYLLRNTSFSEVQIREWHKGFVKDCPSGELNRNKFLDIYQTLFPAGKAKAFYEHVFRTFDKDNSGKIDFKEFLQAISVTQAGRPEDKLELAFRLYDIDGNGAIERKEMTEIIKAIYLMTDKEPGNTPDDPELRTRDIFNRMDFNQDGVISKDEFVKGCLTDKELYRLLACSENEGIDEIQRDIS